MEERGKMSITIEKLETGYSASGFNKFNRFVTVNVPDEASVKEATKAVLDEKSDIEMEYEKVETDKEFLLSEWVVGKTDDELIGKADMFKKPIEGMQIVKGEIYNYVGTLYRSLETFIYDNQSGPYLEPAKWQKLGEKPKSGYQELFDKATYWSRDESYEQGAYVKWYSKLYKALVKVTDNEEPGTGKKWQLVTEA